MAVLLRDKGHGLQKPEVARIDPSHPLAQGLVAAMLFHEGGGAPFDLVRGIQSSLVPTWQADGISGTYSVTHPAYAPVMASPFTIIATVIIYSWPTGGSIYQDAAGCYAYVSESSNKGAFIDLRPQADGASGFAFLAFNNNSVSLYTVARDTTFPLATRLQYAAVWDGATASLYRNGVLIGSKSISAVAAPAANTPFANNQNTPSTMRVLESRLYSRALRHGELARSAAEPYGFLLPQSPRHRLYLPASTVTVTLDSAVLTLTGQTPTATPGPVTATLATATLTLTANQASTTPGPVTATLTTATLTLGANAAVALPGPVDIVLSTATLDLIAQAATATGVVPNVRGYSRSSTTATASSTASVTALGSSTVAVTQVGSSLAGVL